MVISLNYSADMIQIRRSRPDTKMRFCNFMLPKRLLEHRLADARQNRALSSGSLHGPAGLILANFMVKLAHKSA